MKNKFVLLFGIFLSIILFFSFVNAIIWSDEGNIDFEITSTNPVCDDVNFVWKWWNSTSGEPEEKSSLDHCYEESGLDGDGFPRTTCCSMSNECDLDILSATFGHCVGSAAPSSCSEYTTESQCNNANPEVARASMAMIMQDRVPDPGNFCPARDNNYRGYSESVIVVGKTGCYKEVAACRCKWDDTNNCATDASWSDPICDGDTDRTIDGNCSFREREKIDDCENSGYIKYSWTAIWKDGVNDKPDWCADSVRRFRCTVKLFFFTITSLVIAVIVIIIVYLIFFRKKKKLKTAKNRNIKKKKRR